MRAAGWPNWLVGLGVGLAAGFAVLLGGALLLFLGVVVLALAFLARPSLALLSGGFIGLGGLWALLTIRAQLQCEAPSAPAVTCTASGIGPFLAISSGIVLLGVLVGVAAWRRRTTGGLRRV